jgi:hypothetical protein
MKLATMVGVILSLTGTAAAQETPADETSPTDGTAFVPAPPPPPIPDTDDDDRGWLRGRAGRLQRANQPPRVRPPRPDRPRTWFFLMEGGPTYERLYGLSVYGGEGSMAADLEYTHLAVTIGGTFAYGWLEPGLGLTRFQVGTTVLAKEGILRVGAGAGLGLLSISSVTADTDAFGFVFEFAALLTLDLVRFSDDGNRAFYAGAKLRGTLITASDAQPLLWGPSVVLGFRL